MKGYLNLPETEQWLVTNDPALRAQQQRLPEKPGMRYFHEKRLKAELRKACRERGGVLDETLFQELRLHAVEARPLPLSEGAKAEHEMVFHAAFLVLRSAVGLFQEQVERAQRHYPDQGLSLETSGPWPPYNFCPSLQGPSP